ncbi:MAG: glycosyltransferase family 2 protein [Patescibacteria group bacterium]
MPSVDVSIVTWNSAADLGRALDSVFAQTLQPARVFIVDNGSTDATRSILQRYPQCSVTLLKENTGFAAGHNTAINQSVADYVLVLNPDVALHEEYIEKVCAFAEAQPRCAAFVGRVQRPDGSTDTIGLRISPWRIATDLRNQPREPRSVFGVSGAVALYRRAALQDVSVDGEVFNPMLFAYKEDVELAWRLRWSGWQAYSVPAAIAKHSRVLRQETKRSHRSSNRRFLSYRNHLLLYPLVESWATLAPDLWVIIPAELARMVFLLVTDPRVTIRALAAAAKMWHAARTFARRERRTVRASQVRETFRT